MKKRLSIIAIIALLFCWQTNFANETIKLSLKEAIAYGLENNTAVKNADTDIEIAKRKVNETTAIGLPQVNAKISNNIYLNTGTTLIDDFISSTMKRVNEYNYGLSPVVPIPDGGKLSLSFMSKYNATAELSVSQLLFDGSYLVGLQAAKAYVDQSVVQAEKSRIDIKESISNAYFLVLATRENKRILKNTFNTLESTVKETSELHKQGFIEDTEVDQIKLMLSELQTNLIYIENQIRLSESYLKILLGLKIEDQLELSDNLESLLEEFKNAELLSKDFTLTQHIDYKILENQKHLSNLSLKKEKSEYLPKLSAFFTAQQNAMRDKWNFFSGSEDWYPTTLYGFELTIPIFSSGSRKSKVKQAKLNLKKISASQDELRENLKTAEYNARISFKNALQMHLNKKNSSKISKKIYDKSQLKFKEGIISSMDLQQMHRQYLEAEGNYISSILDLVKAKLSLSKVLSE